MYTTECNNKQYKGIPSLPSAIVEPEDCTEFPCMIFEDEFDELDDEVWEHEITMAGGGVSGAV